MFLSPHLPFFEVPQRCSYSVYLHPLIQSTMSSALLEPVLTVNDWKVHVKKQKQKWSRGKNAPVIKTKQVSEILAQDQYTKNLKEGNEVINYLVFIFN